MAKRIRFFVFRIVIEKKLHKINTICKLNFFLNYTKLYYYKLSNDVLKL